MTKKSRKESTVLTKIVSERGEWLRRGHEAQRNSNVNFGKKIIVGQDDNENNIVVSVGQKCPVCKRRVRGLNHTDGAEHKGTVHRHKR